MKGRERFLAACRLEPVERRPLWVMRQAGRYLPEYRALKERYGFAQMVRTPELAAEITLQPIRRYGFDAAILFSDILVIPEALGQPYSFGDKGGIRLEFACDTPARVHALETGKVRERLAYMGEAHRLLRRELGEAAALIGFVGSPWTLAAYMTAGKSPGDCARLKALRHEHPGVFELLLERLTEAVVECVRLQVEAGAEVIQVFDSCAAACPAHEYLDVSIKWIQRIAAALPPEVPLVLFARGMGHRREDLLASGARVLGLDWTVEMRGYRQGAARPVALQGNLDPALLEAESPVPVVRAATALLRALDGETGCIINLGHGITPAARVEHVEALVETVRAHRVEP